MDAHTQVDIQQAFVATSQDIEKMWKTLENSGMAVTATANCSDGIVRHFDQCDPLIKYENPLRASIKLLEIDGRSRDPYASAVINMGARYSAPIAISIRGEEIQVASMRTGLLDTFDGMKPWYSRLATLDLFYVWFPIFTVLILLFQIMTPSNTPKPEVPFQKAVSILMITVLAIGIIGFVIMAVSKMRNRYFPIASFAIGQGLTRYKHYEQIRWVVIVGFVISVMASIIATLLLAI